MLQQHRDGVLEEFFESLQESRARSSINAAVITTHSYFHHIAGGELLAFLHHDLFDPSNCHDTAIGRIDDSCSFRRFIPAHYRIAIYR